MAGRLERESGSMAVGPQVRMGYFSQHQLDTLHTGETVLSEIRRLSDPRTTEEELMSVLGLFLLGKNYFDRPSTALSGGEKSRLLLACLFLSHSNFLVLDEPTNHLDLESREALIEALGNFTGTIFMVAHDRHLISEVAEQIWELTPEGFKVYLDGYQEYLEAKRPEKTAAAAEGGRAESAGTRESQKRLKREQAEQRNRLYKEQKPLQEAYAGTEKELETLLLRQSEVEQRLTLPEVYADKGLAAELLKEFSVLQKNSETLVAKMAELEQKLAEIERWKPFRYAP
jgi:ATP-binding cassette subfamily F protein 3